MRARCAAQATVRALGRLEPGRPGFTTVSKDQRGDGLSQLTFVRGSRQRLFQDTRGGAPGSEATCQIRQISPPVRWATCQMISTILPVSWANCQRESPSVQ